MKNKTVEFLSFAILIEALITYFNQFFVKNNFHWQMLASLALGLVTAVIYKLDLLDRFNLKSHVPYIGCILTGILLSRVSNYVYDLLSKLSN